jgi:SAM-dependent methyltransferase
MSTWVLVFIIFAGVLFGLKLVYVLAAGGTLPVTHGALFVCTSSVRVRSFLDAVPMEPGELLVDLGCGDGRVLRAARKRYGVRALGFEMNPLAYLVARLLTLARPGIRIKFRNFWSVGLGDVHVLFCYLFPDLMGKLARKLEQELTAGSRVVSCNFPIPGWNPQKVLRPDSLRHGDPIYIYRFPDACVGGRGMDRKR